MEKPDRFWWWVILMVVGVFAAWGGYWYAVEQTIPVMEKRGQFGDQFGGVTSIFSGLAFVGVIVAIILQAKELSLQRQELRLARREARQSREELRRSAQAQEKTEAILAQQLAALIQENDRKSCLEALRLMEEVREDRQFVYTCIQDKIEYRALDPTQRARIDRVCRAFDLVGYLDRRGLVMTGLVSEFYADAFIYAFDSLLTHHVAEVRRKRGQTHMSELTQLRQRLS
jgi:hypothetical protein